MGLWCIFFVTVAQGACVCGDPCSLFDSRLFGTSGVCTPDGNCSQLPFLCPVRCPPTVCMNQCPLGYVTIEGCPTCECIPRCPCGKACLSLKLEPGICQADERTCVPVPEDTGQCNPMLCPSMLCPIFCPHGYEFTDCLSCTCREDPAPCRCGLPCATTQMVGVCQADYVTCAHERPAQLVYCPPVCVDMVFSTLSSAPKWIMISHACPLYCPRGRAVSKEGCPSCMCAPEPVLCPCGRPCAEGICDGTQCVKNHVPSCSVVSCPALRCMRFCEHGQAISPEGCPTCQCLAAPPSCVCGQVCSLANTFTGVCQANGSCALSTPSCPPCAPKLCPVVCPLGSVWGSDGCPSCICRTPCPCGALCDYSPNLPGVCQRDGSCSLLPSLAKCDSCPVVTCLNYCPHGYQLSNGCVTCACLPPPSVCPCGRPCPLLGGHGQGVCDRDNITCSIPLGGVHCKPECPILVCLLYCPFGLAMDRFGCAVCACKTPVASCPCGRSCFIAKGRVGVCALDGACRETSTSCEKAKTETCAPVVCTKLCEEGTVLDGKGCPSCTCHLSCPCGQECRLNNITQGRCGEDDRTCMPLLSPLSCVHAEAPTAPQQSSPVPVVVIVGVSLFLLALCGGVVCWRCHLRKYRVVRVEAE